ncbi:MAG: sodium/proline symporter [Deferribacterota bacterium]|nr:sodium/proline symporter [Deferribacterota bacterium]
MNTSANIQLLSAVICYIIFTLLLGFWVARNVKNQRDYYIGSRKLPSFALALSERSSDMSAWIIIGIPGLAWEFGLSTIWVLLGTAGGAVFQWIFYGKKFYKETEKTDAITPNDYLAKKFPESANAIRVLGGISIFVFFVAYVGAQFEGGGKIVAHLFNLNTTISAIIIATIIISYSVAGGFITSVWTDFFQALLMVFTLIILPIIILFNVLGDPSISIVNSLANDKAGRSSLFGGKVGIDALILLGVNLSWFFGYMGGIPHVFVRMMAVRNAKEIKSCTIIAAIWGFLTSAGALLLGLLAFAIYGNLELFVNDREMVFPYIIQQFTPPFLTGILLAGVLAAVMSTASSQIIMASSAISEDILQRILFKKRDFKEKIRLNISRLSTLFIGFLGILLIFYAKEYVYTIVSWGWAGLTSIYAPIITLLFFWKRLSKVGVYSAFIVGFCVTILWVSLGFDKEIITVRLISFPISFISAVIFSLIFPDRKK